MSVRAILLMGPTATGKTELALRLADSYPVEIISVDSALIYRDMDIGTAKPSKDELARVTHHLVDIISPLESYSVAEFVASAVRLIEDINARGKLPLLVGGTMMYYNALLHGLSVLPSSEPQMRLMLEERAQKDGYPNLYEELRGIDIVAASKINVNDKQRIIRALEVYYLTGKNITTWQRETKGNLAAHINFLSLAIVPQKRELLWQRLEERLVQMFDKGFIAEVQQLRNKYVPLTLGHNSMRCVGYYEVWQYLDGMLGFDDLKQKCIFSTRQLAKRQLTWLRAMDNVNVLSTFDIDELFALLLNFLHDFCFS